MANAVILLATLALASAGAVQLKVTPVQKVIEMLSGMKSKGEAMMDAEKKTFDKYAEWVDDQTKELGFEIETGEKDIEELDAFIAKADNGVAKLGRELDELNGDIDRYESERKEATTIRDAENKEFLGVSTDYAESIDAIGRAIEVLEGQNVDRAQADAMLQTLSQAVPGVPASVSAFLQQGAAQPEVAAFKSSSGGIIELLEGLLQKFKTQLSDVEAEETNKAHNFDLSVLHLSNLIDQSKEDVQAKQAKKGKTAAASAKAKGDFVATKDELAADKTLLSDMTSTFKAKSESYADNQKVRKGELEAIAKAIEIISSPAVADSYASRVNLAQVSSSESVSLLQTRSGKGRVAARQLASRFLQKRAWALSSKSLSSAASEVSTNPFVKVVNMIEGLIAKLKQEAAEEASHKQWCDEQLNANKVKRNKKTTKSEELSAEIEELTATIAGQGKEISTLLAEQADLTKAMGEATEDRTAEKAENEATIADALAGAEAVKQALVVLREFYASQAFLQQGQGQAPEIENYKGMASGGIIGMLEVIQTDFARLQAETKSTEAQASMQYDAFMLESTANQKRKHKKEVKLKLDKDQSEFNRSQAKKDLKAVNTELGKANAYFEELKPTCVDIDVSYEERVAKRKEEIKSLNEAYAMLNEK